MECLRKQKHKQWRHLTKCPCLLSRVAASEQQAHTQRHADRPLPLQCQIDPIPSSVLHDCLVASVWNRCCPMRTGGLRSASKVAVASRIYSLCSRTNVFFRHLGQSTQACSHQPCQGMVLMSVLQYVCCIWPADANAHVDKHTYAWRQVAAY